jgi:hypothetical protein
MSDFNWTDYVGMAAGAIGAITGICGGILGYISYRRSNQIKSLDLRLELKKCLNSVNAAYAEANQIIEESNNSRIAVSAAMGKSRSGGMEKWKQKVEADRVQLRKFHDDLPNKEENFKDFDTDQLEQLIIKAHELQTALASLVCKYKEEIGRDDKDREFIRQQAHARINQ